MSEVFRVEDAVRWTGGRLRRGEPGTRFESVTIDSRNVGHAALFVAIRGDRFDGHDFLADVARAGVQGCLVDEAHPEGTAPGAEIAVADTTAALGALAKGHRERHRGPLVAITGSNGKTTTKEMCAAILGATGPCLKTEGNLNNHFGLPLTLLRREAEHRHVVVELGMNHRGEIAQLAQIARADVGVITNVGTAHIEHLGSQEEIALEKGDLVASLATAGTAVLNVDDPRVSAQAERTAARVLRFGRSPKADVRAEDERSDPSGRYHFRLTTAEGSVAVQVAGLGETTVINALAAAAGALAAGCALQELPRGLAAYRPVTGRLEPILLRGGGLLINDTYNANPQSMEEALRTLTRDAGEGQCIAILGDMGELGEHEVAAHEGAGELAGKLGVDRLFAVGANAQRVAAAAERAGIPATATFASEQWEDVAERALAGLEAGDRVLVKGSRAMRMERVVAHLREGFGEARED
ncbi:MAG: UDP-N-acetylmuramoyl-tripeptide--D-alanyl-D-alanine ligase [Myxococcota bacterium]